MAILHLAECDACGERVPADVMTTNEEDRAFAQVNYQPPSGWPQYAGKTFCCLGCLGAWAIAAAPPVRAVA